MEGKPPERGPQPPPGQEPPPPPREGEVVERVERPADPDALPATLGEVRTLRRWLAVAGVWAVAASAIAVIALLEARKEEEEPKGPAAVTGSQLRAVEEDLNKRVDELQSRVQSLPTSDDVRKLEKRLKTVENQSSDTRTDVRKLRSDLDDLSGRVDDVEQAQEDAAAQDDSGNTDTTETTP